MHRSENRTLVDCADCRATIAPSDRVFAISDETFLCFECAVKRGGVYDEPHDRWLVEPNVADEPDERRPHP